MTADRIRQIQSETAYPENVSVQQALFQVWNEVAQEKNKADQNKLPEDAEKRLFLLDNLLCTIHRDGGHFITENGYQKAHNEAIRKVINWIQKDENTKKD